MLKLLLVPFTLIVVSCGSKDPTTPPSTPTDISLVKTCEDPSVCDAEREVFRLVNEKRIENSLNPLENSQELAFGSRQWSVIQVQNNHLSHDGFPLQREIAIQEQYPNFYDQLGAENVAMRYGFTEDGTELGKLFFEMWWQSPGHRNNMLGPFTKIGIGLAREGQLVYGTQLFTY